MARSLLSLRRLATRTRGVSYSLPFVMITPLYLTIMLTAVEIGLLLLAQLGTQYAAHAAARAAVVWESAQPAALRDARIRQAAVMGLAPFVGGRQRELDDGGPVPPEAEEQAADFADAARKFEAPAAAAGLAVTRPYERSRTPPDAAFLARKYKIAAARTTVARTAAGPGPHADLTVTVTFRAPLYMPVVSRFLDPDRSAPFEYPLTSTATLPNDGPTTESRTVGIDYHSAKP